VTPGSILVVYNIGRVLLVVVHRLVLLVERHTSGTGVEALGDGSHTVFLADRAEDNVDLLERELRGIVDRDKSAVELVHIKDERVVKTHLDSLGDPEGEDQVAEVQSSEEEEDPTLVKGDDEEGGSLGDGKVVQPAMRHDRSRISHLCTVSFRARTSDETHH
jgi:hypothetical protein